MSNKEKKTVRIVGALFLIAMVTSLVGAGLIEMIITAPDYLAAVSENESLLRIGVVLELVNGIAVIGIAVMMFPLFKKFDEALALGYVAFRILEAAVILAAVISPLTLIALSQEYVTAEASAASYLQTIGTSFIAMRGHLVGQMLGIFFSLAALIFYYLLYQSKLVPRFISVWGLIAVALVFTWNFLEILGLSINAGIIFGLPIILNEIFLGIWLIVKGFDPSALASEPTKEAINAV